MGPLSQGYGTCTCTCVCAMYTASAGGDSSSEECGLQIDVGKIDGQARGKGAKVIKVVEISQAEYTPCGAFLSKSGKGRQRSNICMCACVTGIPTNINNNIIIIKHVGKTQVHSN